MSECLLKSEFFQGGSFNHWPIPAFLLSKARYYQNCNATREPYCAHTAGIRALHAARAVWSAAVIDVFVY